MGVQPPYLYSAQRNDSRFPETVFDPKAVTRASWEPKPRKPKQEGPLVNFNQHPDSHMVLSYRTGNYASFSPRAKTWIKWMRIVQLLLRVLQLIGALGLLVLMILIKNVDSVSGWVMRITPGIVALHCFYAIYHLARDAAGRTPASSAAYQIFSAVSDLGVLPFYAFGALAVHNKSDDWATILQDQQLMDYFRPAVYYTLIGAGGMHALTLLMSCWLFWMFRKIARLPPDMNPLEDHLTARPKKHKRNKSSINTVSTEASDKRLSTPLEARRKSGLPYEDTSRPPTVPFMHTRTQSNISSSSSKNTLVNLPDRQYQIAASSPRSSVASSPTKRASALGWSHNGIYTEVPLDETSRPPLSSNGSSQPRVPKFTENWMPTDSLISRTNQRNRELAAAKTSAANRGSKSYAALSQPYNDDDSDSDFEGENRLNRNDADADLAANSHPNPLRQNPTSNHASTPPRARTPFYPNVVTHGDVSPDARQASESYDITDEKPGLAVPMGAQRNRQSSIQGDEAFFSRPYGDLKSATPPVMVGSNNRKVSSGNDFDSKYSSQLYERRNVSGKVAEEGRGGAGSRFSGYGRVSERDEW